jgi:hypothetical protein
MFTSLVSAQDVTENQSKENRLLSQFDENRLVVRDMDGCSCSPYAFPDSVYIYYGEEEKPGKTAAIKYDGICRRLKEKGLTDLNGDGITEENEWYLKEYTYTSTKDLFEIETLFTCLSNDIWVTVSKEIYVYNTSGLSSPAEYCSYNFRGGEWKLERKQKRTVTEYEGEYRLVVYLDSTFIEKTNGYDTLTVRVEMSYNEKGWCDLSTSFSPTGSTVTGEEWIPTYKTASTYNAIGELIKEVHHSYDLYYNDGNPEMKWTKQSTVEYAYDEKGNITAETVIDNDGIAHNRARYVNIYSSATSNEAVFSVQSAVYPNPVSDILHVAIEGTDHAIITLLNASGTVVTTQKTNQQLTLLPVQSLAKGFYFLTVQTSEGIKTHKVVVQ